MVPRTLRSLISRRTDEGAKQVYRSGDTIGEAWTGPPATGFTLLELIVTIFIVSLITAFVLPSFFRTGDSALRADARKTASLLRYLNDSSIYTKATFALRFNLEDGTISWDSPEGKKTETIRSVAGLKLPSKGEIRKGDVTVFFGPLGAQEAIEVDLRDHDASMSVVLNPLSGRVKIDETPGT